MSETNVRLTEPDALLATWFGSGLLPKAPGTWGSLAALPFAWGIATVWGSWGLLAGAVAVFALGVWASDRVARRLGREDPGLVVVDEVAGQWLTLLAVPPDVLLYGVGFVLFRLFDIWKPWPVSWAERTFPGGWGIMIDDVVAGLYGLAALAALVHFGVV